ncbi:hypothetical protein R1flu_019768 [Riccia fluitans]|uniref:phosphoglycolate phosphatase n=1 Tax=Riccia fluitans TaxID=41844 RepID=A0ABD1ZJX8_9MARC
MREQFLCLADFRTEAFSAVFRSQRNPSPTSSRMPLFRLQLIVTNSWQTKSSEEVKDFRAFVRCRQKLDERYQAAAMEANGSCVAGKGASLLTDPAQLIKEVETFLFDVDGVIWRGGKLIEGVPETLDMLRAMGKKLFFVTNNSTKSRRMLQEKFRSLGLDIREEEVFSSAFAAAGYLKSIGFPTEKKVYIVGEEGIQQELAQAGFQYLGGPEDGGKKVLLGTGKNVDFDRDVGAVVVGFDHYINYYKMVYATLCIRENPGCLFIATNCDSVAHIIGQQEWPAGGTMVGSVRASTARTPIVVGKPATFMMDYLANKFNISKSKMCMVGDRLDTDILFGQAGGCKTLLVLSGVTDLKTLNSPENTTYPDFYTNQLPDLLAAKKTMAA